MGRPAINNYIQRRAERLVRRFNSRDLFEIAGRLGVYVTFHDGFKSLKGMYAVVNRKRFVIINARLPRRLQRLVCAHKLGHDQLHRALAMNAAIGEPMLMDVANKPESEANAFAAHLLLEDDSIVELVEDGCDARRIALELEEELDILLLKMEDMNRRGYNFIVPYVPPPDFFGRGGENQPGGS